MSDSQTSGASTTRGWRPKRSFTCSMLNLALILSLLVSSCEAVDESPKIALEIVPDSVAYETNEFTGEEGYVIRCTELEKSEGAITVAASKSKQARIVALLFVPERAAATVRIAYVSIPGEESSYDLTKAEFYTVTSASLDTLVPGYGITVADWQLGLTSGSERFPCCE